MVNGIRTIYPCRLSKGFNSKFCVGFRARHKATEEGRSAYQPKCCKYNNEVKDNSSKILSNCIVWIKFIGKLS